MDSEKTRAFLQNIFESVDFDFTTFGDYLSDDLVWTATGDSPLSGRYEGKESYLRQVLGPLHEKLASPIKPILLRILVDGLWAAVHFRSENVRAKNGADFSMDYCWMMKVQGDKIVEVVGWYDQKKMWDIFS